MRLKVQLYQSAQRNVDKLDGFFAKTSHQLRRLVAVLPRFQIVTTNWAALGAEPVVTLVRPTNTDKTVAILWYTVFLCWSCSELVSRLLSPRRCFYIIFKSITVLKCLPVSYVVSHQNDITRSRALESTVLSDLKVGALISVGNRPLPRIRVKIPNSRGSFYPF